MADTEKDSDRADAALALSNVSKTFGRVKVLDSVEMLVRRKTVHGLVGANGAGKSTLVKILSGYHSPDQGASCQLWGVPVQLPLHDAPKAGVTVVQQDMPVAKDLTVLENIAVGGGLGGTGRLLERQDRKAELRAYAALSQRLRVKLPPDVQVGSLSPSEQAFVAILRALGRSSRMGSGNCLLVLDEPTAFLGETESARLFSVVSELVAGGDAIIIVSHRLDDIATYCNDVTVLRSGQVVSRVARGAIDKGSLAEAMLGRRLAGLPSRAEREGAGARRPPVLELSGISGRRVRDLSLAIHPGQVVACVGLVGSGVEDVPYAVMGLHRRSGQMRVDGQAVPGTPRDAWQHGVAIVPGERLARGLWGDGSIHENLWPGGYVPSGFWLSRSRELKSARQRMKNYEVVPPRPELPARQLSGGNQQKVVVSRALETHGLKALVLHDPTAGVDVGARASILELLQKRVAAGLSVLLCSTDVDEVLAIASVVIVLSDGVVRRRLEGGEITADTIAQLIHSSEPPCHCSQAAPG